MGMDDREPNLGETFSTGDRFVLTALKYDGTINTRYGAAEKSLAQIVARQHPTEKIVYSCLGVGLAGQAKRADPSDFPRVVELVEIPVGTGGNRVKRFAKVDVEPRAFLDGDDGPPILEGDTGGVQAAFDDSDDISF